MTSPAYSPAADTVRPLMRTAAAPSRMSTLVTLAAPLGTGARLILAYVPDRIILTRESFAAYAAGRADQTLSPESLAAIVADDVANELVPKWHRVTVATTADGVTHTVAVEDRQPGWDHPSLLTAVDAPSMAKG